MDGGLKLGRIFGIDIKIHSSWIFIVVLLAWILSTNFFPHFYPEFTTLQNWIIGSISVLLLFASVLFHEFAHSLIAKAKGIEVHSITLFFFGGVSNIETEDLQPFDELVMAISGPLSSALLALVCAIFFHLTQNYLMINAVFFYIFQLNIVLAIFNMVPGFPLDGGRALRAILRAVYGDLKKATKIASNFGRFFAVILIILGIAQIYFGSWSGLWLIFLGMFLHFIAKLSFEQVLFYDVLSKWKVSQFIERIDKKNLIDAEQNLKDFIEEHLTSKHTVFLTKKKDSGLAVLDLKMLDSNLKKDLANFKISDVSVSLDKLDNLDYHDSTYDAFKKFLETESIVLSVKKDKKLVGLIFKDQIMNAMVRKLKFDVDFKDAKVQGNNHKKQVTKGLVTKGRVTKKQVSRKTKTNKKRGGSSKLPLPKKP